MLPLLIEICSATLLVENQYFKHHCAGPPDTIYVFNVSDPFAYDPTLNETFPSYFRFHFGDVTVGDAANCYVPIPGIACTDSLDPSLSLPYLSGSTTWFQDIDNLEASVPTGANGFTYCLLFAANIGDSSALLGYEAMLLLEKKEQCYDDYFKCDTNGDFSHYESKGCTGAILDQIGINTTAQVLESPHLGNITVQLKTFTTAQEFYSWNQHVPTVDLVPQFDTAIDYIAAVVFGIAITLALSLPVSTVMQYLKDKKRLKIVNYIVLISHFFFFFWSIMVMLFWRLTFPVIESMAIFAEFRQNFFNIASLLFTMRTGHMIYVLHVFVFVVHAVCMGSSYNEYLANGGDNNYILSVDPNTANFLNSWDNASYFWIIFMFVWNCTPPLLISLKLITLKYMTASKNDKSHAEVIKKLFQIDRHLPLLLAGQIAVISGYLILKYLKLQTPILRNDIVYQDVTSFGTFFMIVHVILSSRINETIRISLQYQFTQTIQTTAQPESLFKTVADSKN
ncbi:hypothetical protein HDV01_004182 [Terramyces sp. JEL0728]|nr:hypothetical protein HDV01_004182 [Terramyces sp. JEL0728]